MPTFNKKSSHTADGLVYIRILTNIPLAKEIFNIFQKLQGVSLEEMKQAASRTYIYPFMEARYLMTSRELEKSGVNQIFELASGFSPRGIKMTKSPTVTYVELDLPDKLKTKVAIVDELIKRGNIKTRNDLYFEGGNVISTTDFERGSNHFKNEPVGVICEGLLRYISKEDIKKLARNIFNLLKHNGGVWITPDIEFFDPKKLTPEEKKYYDDRVQKLGYDVRLNLFKDENEAETFFNECGFHVIKIPLTNIINELVIPSKIGISKEEALKSLVNRFVFSMTVN